MDVMSEQTGTRKNGDETPNGAESREKVRADDEAVREAVFSDAFDGSDPFDARGQACAAGCGLRRLGTGDRRQRVRERESGDDQEPQHE